MGMVSISVSHLPSPALRSLLESQKRAKTPLFEYPLGPSPVAIMTFPAKPHPKIPWRMDAPLHNTLQGPLSLNCGSEHHHGEDHLLLPGKATPRQGRGCCWQLSAQMSSCTWGPWQPPAPASLPQPSRGLYPALSLGCQGAVVLGRSRVSLLPLATLQLSLQGPCPSSGRGLTFPKAPPPVPVALHPKSHHLRAAQAPHDKASLPSGTTTGLSSPCGKGMKMLLRHLAPSPGG